MKKYMSLHRALNKPTEVLFLPSGAIGDALMMLALCAEIKELNPQTRFTIVARRNAALIHDLALAYPFIQVVAIPKNAFGLWSLLWNSLKKPYKVLMPGAFGKGIFINTKNFFTLLKFRPGTHTYGLLNTEEEKRENPYQSPLAYDPYMLHFDNLRHLARLAGLAVKTDAAPLKLEVKTLSNFVPPYRPDKYIVFHPFGSSSWKSFPPRRSKELLQLLIERYPELSIVVTGGVENEAEAKEITQGLPRIMLATNLPILELAALIKSAVLYLGVDTGPTHLAAMLTKESVVLSHNTGVSWKQSYNPKGIILTNDTHCLCDGKKGAECKVIEDGKPYLRCLYDITNEVILEAVQKFLQ
jgi:ADP-heptose:LPS heptosyltransferase